MVDIRRRKHHGVEEGTAVKRFAGAPIDDTSFISGSDISPAIRSLIKLLIDPSTRNNAIWALRFSILNVKSRETTISALIDVLDDHLVRFPIAGEVLKEKHDQKYEAPPVSTSPVKLKSMEDVLQDILVKEDIRNLVYELEQICLIGLNYHRLSDNEKERYDTYENYFGIHDWDLSDKTNLLTILKRCQERRELRRAIIGILATSARENVDISSAISTLSMVVEKDTDPVARNDAIEAIQQIAGQPRYAAVPGPVSPRGSSKPEKQEKHLKPPTAPETDAIASRHPHSFDELFAQAETRHIILGPKERRWQEISDKVSERDRLKLNLAKYRCRFTTEEITGVEKRIAEIENDSLVNAYERYTRLSLEHGKVIRSVLPGGGRVPRFSEPTEIDHSQEMARLKKIIESGCGT